MVLDSLSEVGMLECYSQDIAAIPLQAKHLIVIVATSKHESKFQPMFLWLQRIYRPTTNLYITMGILEMNMYQNRYEHRRDGNPYVHEEASS